MKPTDIIDIENNNRSQISMNDDDDWGMDPWTYGGLADRWGSGDRLSYEEIDAVVKSCRKESNEGLKARIRELEIEVMNLRSKAKKKEVEFKEFRKIRKAIKADSVNTRMARLVKNCG